MIRLWCWLWGHRVFVNYKTKEYCCVDCTARMSYLYGPHLDRFVIRQIFDGGKP